jgi:hypothetical protein
MYETCFVLKDFRSFLHSSTSHFSRRDGFDAAFKHGTEKNNRRTKTKRKVLYLVMMLRDSLSFLAPSPASLLYQSLRLFHANARVEGQMSGLWH